MKCGYTGKECKPLSKDPICKQCGQMSGTRVVTTPLLDELERGPWPQFVKEEENEALL